MRRVHVPPLDREVSVLGFGCASLGSRISAAQGRRALDRAFDLGIGWYDVAPPYGDGEAETHLGRFAQGRRDKIVICTKFGIPRPSISLPKRLLRPLARRLVAALPGIRTAVSRSRPTAQHTPIDLATIEPSVAESLRRLRSDYIDVLAIHEPTPEEAADGRIYDILDRLLKKGMVRSVSVAAAPASIEAAAARSPLVAFAQFPDAPFTDAAPALRETLAAPARPVFVTHGVFAAGAPQRLAALALAERPDFRAIAAERGLDPGAASDVLMDFAFCNNPDGVVIASMFSTHHIERNCAIASKAPSPDAAAALRRLVQTEEAKIG